MYIGTEFGLKSNLFFYPLVISHFFNDSKKIRAHATGIKIQSDFRKKFFPSVYLSCNLIDDIFVVTLHKQRKNETIPDVLEFFLAVAYFHTKLYK